MAEQAPAPAPAPMWDRGVKDAGIDADNVSVVTLLRLRDQMKQQLAEYKVAVLARQENFTNVVEEKLIQSAIQNLKKKIEDVKISFRNKTLALQRAQIADALKNKLDQDDEDSRLIAETIQQIKLLSQKIIQYQQQVHQKEDQLIDIQKKRYSLKITEERKLHQIQTKMKTQKEKQASRVVTEIENRRIKLENERQTTTIIQNVFQNIIIGSRVNWAEDPSLKAIVLQLEKNVYFQ